MTSETLTHITADKLLKNQVGIFDQVILTTDTRSSFYNSIDFFILACDEMSFLYPSIRRHKELFYQNTRSRLKVPCAALQLLKSIKVLMWPERNYGYLE